MTRHQIILFLLTIVLVGQINSQSTITVKKETVPTTTILEDRPAFFKGNANDNGLFINNYIETNIKVPDSVKTGLITGRVFIGFTVKETGELTNIRVIKGLKGCASCDKEALRLFNVMPKWTPALVSSKPVSSDQNWTVSFKQSK